MLRQLKQLLANGHPLRIAVQVVPKSRTNQIVSVDIMPVTGTDVTTGATINLRVKINKIPEKGLVNEELIRFLAKNLGLPISQIKIVSGFTGRHKILVLSNHAL